MAKTIGLTKNEIKGLKVCASDDIGGLGLKKLESKTSKVKKKTMEARKVGEKRPFSEANEGKPQGDGLEQV